MANTRNGNSIYVTETGLSTGSNETNVKVVYILFTPDLANDQMILKERDTNGDIKLNLRGATAKTTMFFDFSAAPITFKAGIFISTLTASATATLITSTAGGE